MDRRRPRTRHFAQRRHDPEPALRREPLERGVEHRARADAALLPQQNEVERSLDRADVRAPRSSGSSGPARRPPHHRLELGRGIDEQHFGRGGELEAAGDLGRAAIGNHRADCTCPGLRILSAWPRSCSAPRASRTRAGRGIVYHERYRAATFKVECLREYARYAPFRTVEFDFPFYRPPTEAQLARYAKALPAGFPVVSKVWEEITMPRFPELPRHGPRGRPARIRGTSMRAPSATKSCRRTRRRSAATRGPSSSSSRRSGSPRRPRRAEFLGRLDGFLGGAAGAARVRGRDPHAGVLRPGLLRRPAPPRRGPRLQLVDADAAPARAVGGGAAAARASSPWRASSCRPGVPYEQAVARFQPYDRMQAPARGHAPRPRAPDPAHHRGRRGRLRPRQQPLGGLRAADDPRPRPRARHRDPGRPAADPVRARRPGHLRARAKIQTR